MPERLSDERPVLWKGAMAGAMAGLAASWAMTRFQVALSGRGETGSENPQSNKPVEGRDDAAMKAADETAKAVIGRPLTRDEKTEVGGPAAHYVFGMAAGTVYGLLCETRRSPGPVQFGAGLWTIADQLGLPLAGLSPWPLQAYPLGTNAQHLAAHIVYGVGTAVTYALFRRALQWRGFSPASVVVARL